MLNRSSAPSFSKNFSFELPQPEVIRLSGLIDLIFLPGLQQEVFKAEIICKAGKWHEPKPGLSHFTSLMLDKGTSGRSSREIAEILDFYGAQVEISPGHDFVSISLYGLKKYARAIFSVLMEILNDPVFPDAEFDLQKQIFLQNLEINEKKNSFLASRLIRKNIFGPDHPYGRPVEKSDVGELGRKELAEYHASHFSPYEIYLIGNFDSAHIHWFQDQFARVKAEESGVEKVFHKITGDPVQRIAKADSVQSSIRLGKSIINRKHPDYFYLLLLNHILGGYFGSRLMKNIREEKGLTYGIYSTISPFKHDCMFSIGADVNKNNIELTVNEIKKELASLTRDLIPEEELEVAKNHLLGSFQLEVANPFSTLDKIKSIRLNQLNENYYHNLFSSLKLASPVNLQAVAQKYFDPENLIEVSVG